MTCRVCGDPADGTYKGNRLCIRCLAERLDPDDERPTAPWVLGCCFLGLMALVCFGLGWLLL